MKRLMTVQDLPALRTASDPQISPDGARIAFVVRTMDVARNGYSSHIWVVPMDGGAGRHAGASPWTGGADNDGSPRWSPDSGTLAFAGRRGTPGDQVFLLTAGGEPRPVTDLPPGRVSELAWSPDGSRIAVRFQRQVEVWTDAAAEERRRLHHSQPPRVITRLGYRAEGEGYVTDSHPAHLLVVDLAAQATRAVTTGGRDCGSFCWSPDGARIAYAVNAAADPDLMPKAQGVHILSVADPATVTPLDVPLGPKIGLAWSPDGTMIAYLGHADAEEVWDVVNMHPWVASPSGGARDLMPDCDLHFGGASLSDIAGGGSCGPHWMPDSRSLLALAAEGGAMALWRVPVGGVGAVRMLGGGAQSILGVTLDATGETAALLAGGPARPGEISALSLSGRPRRLTRLSDAPLGGVALSAPAAFRARSPEGHDVPCWAFFPPRPAPDGGWPPAVLFLHGGPQMMHLNVLSHEIQLLAAQGYVVLTLDPRGAKGHGQAWTQALKGQWGAPACADVLACVDHAVQQEWVDPRRLGVLGGSYGGYLTAFILGRTGRFAAAVAERGVYNLVSMAGTTDMPWVDHGYFAADVSDAPGMYLSNSPLTYANAITTPLLLIHGEGDLRCPVDQSEQLFAALKRQGKEVVFVRYGPEANHGLSRTGPPDLRLDRLERILTWFRSHLTP